MISCDGIQVVADVNKFAEDMRGIGISTAYELRPGAVYALKSDRLLSMDQRNMLRTIIDRELDGTGIKFVILEPPLSIVEPPDA